MNDSTKLAKLWMTLNEIKEQLDNVAIPLGIHLGLDDPDLMIAMEELSTKINVHSDKFRLISQARRLEIKT